MATVPLPEVYRQVFSKLNHDIRVAQRRGLHSQSIAFIESFAETYLQSLSLFSQLKTQSEWYPELPQVQTNLVQANVLLYPEVKGTFKDFLSILWIRFPAQLWQDRGFYLTSLAICLVSAVLSFVLVRQNFELAPLFIPSFLRSSHSLDAYLFSTTAQTQMLTAGREMGTNSKLVFASLLMINNIRVALLCFISGCLYGLPTLFLLVQTGLMLGALPALFYGKHFVSLWAWLLPHGVPEVSAIILAGGAGLKLGLAMLAPHKKLSQTLRDLTGIVGVCVGLLIWAGLVESFVRQSTLSDTARLEIAVFSLGIILLLFWRAYYANRSLQNTTPTHNT